MTATDPHLALQTSTPPFRFCPYDRAAAYIVYYAPVVLRPISYVPSCSIATKVSIPGFNTSSAYQHTDTYSPDLAQIWRRNRVVSLEDARRLLPPTDRNGRLVATLGSKSSLKRINRKQILDVDVAKACQTIVDPVAPMALRLQGSLL
jgi:hypothetical protein